MIKQLFHREVRLASASNFETFLTVRELSTPAGTVELKFETVFAGAKDAQAKQTKAQFFISQSDVQNIRLALTQCGQTVSEEVRT